MKRKRTSKGGEKKKDFSPQKTVKPEEVEVNFEINACGAQCPGPILKLAEKLKEMKVGEVVKIEATDPGFKHDIPVWCESTGNSLLSLEEEKGKITALIQKGEKTKEDVPCPKDKKTIIVFSDDLDRVLAAFIIANGAASMGNEVTMFFTFWGLNVLRRREKKPVEKDIISKVFGAMMPKGPKSLKLSKMNFGGMGTEMMKFVMKNKNVDSLDLLIGKAKQMGVRFVACKMTMEIMGIKKEELIEGVEEGGVASYLGAADKANLNLFI